MGAARILLALACVLSAWTGVARAAEEQGSVAAFIGVTVIRAYGGPRLKNQTVVVRDGRIAAVGPASRALVPKGARILGRPGQTVAPGLADMHVHIFEPDDGVLFLANGVTTVRNMNGRADTNALAGRIAAGLTPGPYIYTSSPILDGPTPEQAAQGGRRTPQDMRRLVAQQAKAGYMAVKLYENLSAEAFKAGVEEARARGLQVYAHAPFSMTLEQVLALHLDSIEHLSGFDRALAPQSQSSWDEERWAAADRRRIARLARQVAASGVWSDATLATWVGVPRAFTDIAAAEAALLYQYATPRERMLWRRHYDSARAARDPAVTWAVEQKAHVVHLAMIKALHDAGAPLLIGTDAPQPFVFPGFSLHDELAMHRAAGLAPKEILRIATSEAARFLHKPGEFGIIAPGARADLLLLDADPESDLTVLRAPAGVMAAGRWYDAATLRRLLADVAGRNARPPANRE